MSTNSNSPEPTLEERQEFFKQCMFHDWFYQYADDGKSYREGAASSARLSGKARSHPEFLKIYTEWKEYCFGGPAFGKESKPKPTMPEV